VQKASRKRQLQVILSWREKLLHMQEQGKPSSEGDLLNDINERLGAVREGIRTDLDRAAARLRKVLKEQDAFLKRLSTGNISPVDANRQHHAYTDRIAALRTRLTEENQLLNAKASHDVGGFLDMPVDSYRIELRQSKRLRWPFQEDRAPLQTASLLVQVRNLVLAITVAALLGVAAASLYIREARDIQFEGRYLSGKSPRIAVECTNGALNPILLYAPAGDSIAMEGKKDSYGIRVYVRVAGDKDFRLFPSTGEFWYHLGRPTAGLGPISIPPGLKDRVVLDLKSIRTPGSIVEEVRLDFIGRNGTLLDSFRTGL
jgi:hypothetical protein